MRKAPKLLTLDNCKIGYRNFEGRPGQYNREGDRSFVIFLDSKLAEKLTNEGWNVKYPKSDRDDYDREPYLPVKVQFKTRQGRPSSMKIILIMGENHQYVTEENALDIDRYTLEKADIRIRGYEYDEGKFSAYLDTMYVTVQLDEFQQRYGF